MCSWYYTSIWTRCRVDSTATVPTNMHSNILLHFSLVHGTPVRDLPILDDLQFGGCTLFSLRQTPNTQRSASSRYPSSEASSAKSSPATTSELPRPPTMPNGQMAANGIPPQPIMPGQSQPGRQPFPMAKAGPHRNRISSAPTPGLPPRHCERQSQDTDRG